MSKLTRFADYKDRYDNVRFDRTPDGVLTMTLHTDGDSIVWAPGNAHDEIAFAFSDVAGDPEVEVLILTGAGDDFIVHYTYGDAGEPVPAVVMERLGWSGYQLITNFLDIQVPCIAALNGPTELHSELALMCDVVIAAEDATLMDRAHFAQGVVPGDGIHLVWPLVVGQNRARYFLTTDLKLTAREAMAWGAVNEVVPKAEVLGRAHEIAAKLLAKPTTTRRFTRHLLTQPFRKAAAAELNHGLFVEGYGMQIFTPRGDRPLYGD
ncbi:enoyl-CoA hydratase/isomerase family protein [Actinocorallia sp. A-T 12471]|uniref:enoyl-CoA hydratase/isomerase family protein n=1 Tax=Actinocorallia sp. A-T 12471 TaxID=3089813 RepID=UPI0029CFFA0B|nr:enoyl-CoA hydratase/isomerase family protein [Actinocorallia sp. A-T 12471]MDX6740579.1 enoyl-CoA hydratase/isomerase family protein [Actinocorallia sp. A-T 12471]